MTHFNTDVSGKIEKVYRTKEGKLIFNAIPSVGIDNTVDLSELHERMAEHFYLGDGWPKGHPDPNVIREGVIWSAFRNERIKNEQAPK